MPIVPLIANALPRFGCGRTRDQIALRADRRLAPRLNRVSTETMPPRRRLSGDATYWIAGGLGRVGRLEEGQELARRALARAEETDHVGMRLDARWSAAEVFERAGRGDE